MTDLLRRPEADIRQPRGVSAEPVATRHQGQPASRRTILSHAARNWGLTLAVLALAGVAGVMASIHRTPPCNERAPRQAILHEKAKAEVAAIVREIRALPSQPVVTTTGSESIGTFDGTTISLNVDELPGGTPLLLVAGHECVHAMFEAAAVTSWGKTVRQLAVEEATAQVLGTLLAGSVLEHRGVDAPAWVEAELATYRSYCPVEGWRPDGLHIRLKEGHTLGPEARREIATHCPPRGVVDEIERLCRAESDPWVAIRAVKQRYGYLSREGAQFESADTSGSRQ